MSSLERTVETLMEFEANHTNNCHRIFIDKSLGRHGLSLHNRYDQSDPNPVSNGGRFCFGPHEDERSRPSQTRFDRQRVFDHGYITLSRLQTGQHTLTGKWILPNGTVKD